jgi:hypothetical protein
MQASLYHFDASMSDFEFIIIDMFYALALSIAMLRYTIRIITIHRLINYGTELDLQRVFPSNIQHHLYLTCRFYLLSSGMLFSLLVSLQLAYTFC